MVSPAAQGRGVGRALAEEMVRWHREQGYHGIQFNDDDNLATRFRFDTKFIHDFTVLRCAGNVISAGSGVDLSFDHHKYAPYANLFTDIDVGAGHRTWKCGGGANLERLLARARTFRASPEGSPIFDRWHEPWEFADVPTTIERLDRAGFTDIDVTLEPSDVSFPDRDSFREFVACVCLRDHLSRMPDALRPDFLDALADQAADDDPPFTLDYWRLNMAATKPAGREQAA